MDVNQNPITSANVEFFENDVLFGAVSDKDGYFLISDVPEGDYVINVTHIAYQDYIQRVSFPKNSFVPFALWTPRTISQLPHLVAMNNSGKGRNILAYSL